MNKIAKLLPLLEASMNLADMGDRGPNYKRGLSTIPKDERRERTRRKKEARRQRRRNRG